VQWDPGIPAPAGKPLGIAPGKLVGTPPEEPVGTSVGTSGMSVGISVGRLVGTPGRLVGNPPGTLVGTSGILILIPPGRSVGTPGTPLTNEMVSPVKRKEVVDGMVDNAQVSGAER
jgi:hypothetical protein